MSECEPTDNTHKYTCLRAHTHPLVSNPLAHTRRHNSFEVNVISEDKRQQPPGPSGRPRVALVAIVKQIILCDWKKRKKTIRKVICDPWDHCCAASVTSKHRMSVSNGKRYGSAASLPCNKGPPRNVASLPLLHQRSSQVSWFICRGSTMS